MVKARPTHVADNKVIDDGYNVLDLESFLTVETLQKVLNTTETDIDILWDMLIGNKKEESVSQPEILKEVTKEEKPINKVVKKTTKKNA